jgi:hypothetical protein
MFRATCIGVLTLAAAIGGPAVPAAADPVADGDSVYLGILQDHGVSIGAPVAMKKTALGICRRFDEGLSFAQVGTQLLDDGATVHQAAVEIVAAVDVYCPRNAYALSIANPTPQLV